MKLKKFINKINIPIFMITYIFLIIIELLYRVLVFGYSNAFNIEYFFIILLYILPCSILSIINNNFKNIKVNKITYYIILFFISLYYAGTFVFHKLFNTFFSLSVFGLSDQALEFSGTIMEVIIKNIVGIIILYIPFIIILILNKKINFNKNKLKTYGVYVILMLLYIPVYLLIINYNKDDEYSIYNLIYNVDNNAMNVRRLGVVDSLYFDVTRLVFGFEENIIINYDNNDESNIDEDEEYNIVNIDFDNLDSTSDKTVISMDNYFKNDSGTKKNSYTGYFKDKNLIVIMAESFNTIAIDEELTPTLYKLSNSGFKFNNFYTPINLSTIGGEFQDLTGLFANLSDLSNYWRKGKNYFPYGLGNIYKNNGYSTYAYHANQYNFQDRDKYLKAIGFDNYLGKNNGLEKVMNTNIWPESDLELVDATYENWINEDRFMSYYVSVSGHMPYTKSGNAMTKKNWDLVKDLDLSDDAKGYIAANIELDKAVESLINKLEEAGKLDDTVIAIIPDHYPYSMDLETINELSSYERDDTIEINHSTLILWNNNMETVEVNKTASQLDFIPTLYNLFGLEYDSRLFMGKDILSDCDGLVFFNDRSWVTDKGRYYASSGKFVPNDGEVDEEYVDKINNIVSNRINMSKLIIEKDYYKRVLYKEE